MDTDFGSWQERWIGRFYARDVKSRRDDFNVLDNFKNIKTSIIRKFKNYTKVRETSFSVFFVIYKEIYIYQKYTDIRNIPEIYQEYIIF